ncbi:MAG: hypothetical protein ABFC80_04280 [Coriobacteriales bacterium]|nr:hypothetical protein [Actinomycetes bacterium]
MKRTLVIAVAVVALVFGLVAYAGAATSGTTTVSAAVNPQMEITVPGTTTLSNVDPYTPGTGTCTVTGKSNKTSTLSASITKDGFTSLESTVAAGAVSFGKGGNLSYTDHVTGTVDWDTTGGANVSGSITYTISQP